MKTYIIHIIIKDEKETKWLQINSELDNRLTKRIKNTHLTNFMNYWVPLLHNDKVDKLYI